MACGVLLYLHMGQGGAGAGRDRLYRPPAEEAEGVDSLPMSISKWLYQAQIVSK